MVRYAIPDILYICRLSLFWTALRIEWCRTRARAMRWSEEVLLVQEEMRRVLEYMSWLANWWSSHAAVPSMAHDPYLTEGLTAYVASILQEHKCVIGVNRILGNIYKIKKGLDDSNQPNIRKSMGKVAIQDETHENATHLIMFLPCNAR